MGAIVRLLCALALLSPTVARADPLDDLVQAVMTMEQVPGAAVVVVKEGEAPDVRAYGVRELDGDAPVDSNTAFGLASVTKGFTAVLAGQAVDLGALSWDGRVVEAMPGFSVADPYVTANTTLRDLLAHRTGTVRGDLLWFSHPAARGDALIAAMHGLPQETSFREGFAYSNLMYTAAGLMSAQARGQSWEEAVEKNILLPLGMADTLTGAGAATGNTAGRHAFDGEQVRRFTLANPPDNTAPSGALYSSASDMARWLGFWLSGGKAPDGTQLVSSEAFGEMTSIQSVIHERSPIDSFQYDADADLGYGFGWFIGYYRGHRVLTHLGGGDGVAAMIAWMPDAGVAVAAMMNLEGSLGRLAIRNAVFDAALGQADEQAMTRFAQLHAEWNAYLRESAAAARKDYAPRLPTSDELAAWPGTYRSAEFGAIEILREGEGISLQFDGASPIPLHPWAAGKFQLALENPAFNWPEPALITFETIDQQPMTLTFSAGGQSGTYHRAGP